MTIATANEKFVVSVGGLFAEAIVATFLKEFFETKDELIQDMASFKNSA